MAHTPGVSRVSTDKTLDDGRAPSFQTYPQNDAPSTLDSATYSPVESEKKPTHQRFVLADPVASRYLEEDPSTQVLARRERLEGYECYVVEQWACSRSHPTFVIATYSGDPAHSIIVNVLSVPTDEKSWSPRLKVYYKALSQYHARRRETPLGILMITNLSNFPSSLNVILVPEGDLRLNRRAFFVNEDLKRLGCSGRVALSVAPPVPATKSKFYQLYKTSTDISFDAAVVELVKLCQAALMLFGKLPPEYADGLLCDVTEKAINEWWSEIGADYYNVEPHDGVLGPTTVSALLGLLIGARNRLHACGAPVSKDVFDVETTKRAIAHFQKSQHIPKTRRFDRPTMVKLHRATAKAASSDGWLVPRAVKSTVAELSGKGGEMVLDIVGGGREKASIGEVETTDIEHFVTLIQGDRCKWLWRGKKWKNSTGHGIFDSHEEHEDMVFQHGENGGYEWSRPRKGSPDPSPHRERRKGPSLEPSPDFGDVEHAASHEREEKDRNRIRKGLPERTNTQRTHEGRGLGRLKDAVGLRSYHQKSHRDGRQQQQHEQMSPAYQDARSSPNLGHSPNPEVDGPSYKKSIESNMAIYRRPTLYQTPTETYDRRELEARFFSAQELVPAPLPHHVDTTRKSSAADTPTRSPTSSVPGSRADPNDSPALAPAQDAEDITCNLLRRTQSFAKYERLKRGLKNNARWPRHMSFSLVEDSVLTWQPVATSKPVESEGKLNAERLVMTSLAARSEAQNYGRRLADLENMVGEWVQRQLSAVYDIEKMIDTDQSHLDSMYYPRKDEFDALRLSSSEKLSEEHSRLDREVNEIEVLGARLEYEINALKSKVDEAEEGVSEFERQVRNVEDRVLELERKMMHREGWLHWMIRITTGIGRKPPPVPETHNPVD